MRMFCRPLLTALGFVALLFAASFNFTAGAQSAERLDQSGSSGGRHCVLVASQPPALMVTLLCR